MACERHQKDPVKGYHECPGCEIESLRTDAEATISAKDAEIERLKKENVGYASNLRGKHSVSGATYQHMQTTISQQAERIKELEIELQDMRHKEVADLQKSLFKNARISQQSAALKLAKDALESCDVGDCSTSYVVMPSFDAVAIDEALAAIDALGE